MQREIINPNGELSVDDVNYIRVKEIQSAVAQDAQKTEFLDSFIFNAELQKQLAAEGVSHRVSGRNHPPGLHKNHFNYMQRILMQEYSPIHDALKNYQQIEKDVIDIIQEELERMMDTPELESLIIQKNSS